MRICVLTGDHTLSDATKPGAQYGPEDLRLDGLMRDAFGEIPEHDFSFLNKHDGLFETFRAGPPDLVVNFCDTGFRNQATQELHVPALLELLGIPYTGCTPASMVLCYDKEIIRLVAGSLGVPVPREFYLGPDAPLDGIPEVFPALVKPNRADGSLGITMDAVVRDRESLRAYVDKTRALLPGRALLIQEYLDGPEYTVGLIGNQNAGYHCLPVLEVDYSGLPAGFNPILSYESKTEPDSPYYTDIRYRQAQADEAVLAPLRRHSQLLFERFSLQDYGRFDFRAGADGVPRLLEINPNPAWDAEAKFALMAGFAGIRYAQMLGMILDTAIARTGLKPS